MQGTDQPSWREMRFPCGVLASRVRSHTPPSAWKEQRHMEALWKRQTAAERSSCGPSVARLAAWATNGSRPSPCSRLPKEEVACSGQAPPIAADPLPKRNVRHCKQRRTCSESACGSVVEARRVTRAGRRALCSTSTASFRVPRPAHGSTTRDPGVALTGDGPGVLTDSHSVPEDAATPVRARSRSGSLAPELHVPSFELRGDAGLRDRPTTWRAAGVRADGRAGAACGPRGL